jgi:hypothetical protein
MRAPFALRSALAALPMIAVVVACGTAKPGSTFLEPDGLDDASATPIDPLGPSGPLADGGTVTFDGGTCAASKKQAEVAQLDIILLLDTSLSMSGNDKWKSIKNALISFTQDPRASDIGLSISFFPKYSGPYTVCDESIYATPDVMMSTLIPSHALDVSYALEARTPLGGTPMGPAVQGALRFARQWQAQQSNHKAAFVLATDGLPDDSCGFTPNGRSPNTLAAVQGQATAALAAAQTIPTYVIGVGTELTALNSVAQAGGTGQAIIVDPKGDTTGQLIAAFDKIRRSELSCEYGIPAPEPGQKLDYAQVNVRFVDELGYADFLYVPSPDKCSTTDYGWYYDNPANPTRILLCEPFCGEVRSSRIGRLEVLLGCQRNEAPVR